MRKLLTKIIGITLGLAMAVGVGVGVAANRTAAKLDAAIGDSITGGDMSSGVTSGWTTSGTGTYSSNGVKFDSKNDYVQSPDISTHSLKDVKVSLKAGHNGGSGSVLRIASLDGSGNVIDYEDFTPTEAYNSQTTTYDFELSGSDTINNIRITMTSKTNNLGMKYCEVFDNTSSGGEPAPELSSISVSTAPTKTEYIEGDTFDPTGLVITRTYSDESSSTYSYAGHASDFTFTPSTSTELTTEDTSVTIGYGGKTTTQLISVEAYVGTEYVLCTSAKDLEAGAKYIFTNGTSGTVKAMSTANNSNNRRETDVVVNNETKRITNTRKTLILELGGSSGEWTFATTNYSGTDGYLASAASGNSNYLRVISEANTATIAFEDSAATVVIGPHSTRKTIMYNSNLFACYESGYDNVYLWKEYKVLTGLNITGSPTKLSYYESESFNPSGITSYKAVYADESTRTLEASYITWPDLEVGMTEIRGSYSENGVTVYTPNYSISVLEDTLSTVSLSGTMVASYFMDEAWNAGTIVVTGHYASGQEANVTSGSTFSYYKDSSMTQALANPASLGAGENQTIYVKATFSGVSNTTGYSQTVTVTVEHGSVDDDPLTVNEAITKGVALDKDAETSKLYYILGTVASVESNDLGGVNDYATFVFQDDNATVDFKGYRIGAATGCTNYEDLRAGAEVLIQCKIKKFSTTVIENGSVGEIKSITFVPPALEGVSLNKTELLMGVGEEETLVLSASPLGAELGDVTWTTSDDDVATVADGVVTAIGVGSATITAEAGGFSATCDVNVTLAGSLDLSTDTTESASVASLSWKVTNKFDMIVEKSGSTTDANNYYPGTSGQSYSSTRFYKNSFITFTPNVKTVGVAVIFTATTSGYATALADSTFTNATASASGTTVVVTITDGRQPFTIKIGGTCGFTAVKYYYNAETAKNEITRSQLGTRDLLSYHYSKDGDDPFVYSNVTLRFSGFISADLWDRLVAENDVLGFGILYAKTDELSDISIKEWYEFALDDEDGDIDAAISSLDSFIGNAYAPLTESRKNPSTAVEAQKAELGVDVGDSYYIWSHREVIASGGEASDEELIESFSAIAYIRLGDELLFLQETTKSAQDAAFELLFKDIYAVGAFDGSLYNLAHLGE